MLLTSQSGSCPPMSCRCYRSLPTEPSKVELISVLHISVPLFMGNQTNDVLSNGTGLPFFQSNHELDVSNITIINNWHISNHPITGLCSSAEIDHRQGFNEALSAQVVIAFISSISCSISGNSALRSYFLPLHRVITVELFSGLT